MEIMSVLEYTYILSPLYFFLLLSTHPWLCATPRCPWWAAQLRKPFKKGFLFSSSLLLLFFCFFFLLKIHLSIPLFISTPPFFYSILLAPIHPSSIINPTWFLFLLNIFYLNLSAVAFFPKLLFYFIFPLIILFIFFSLSVGLCQRG